MSSSVTPAIVSWGNSIGAAGEGQTVWDIAYEDLALSFVHFGVCQNGYGVGSVELLSQVKYSSRS